MTLLRKLRWHISRKLNSFWYYIRFSFYPYTKIAYIKIPVNKNWSYSLLKALYKKDYEGGELVILHSVLDKNDKVLELGTGLGLLSAYTAKTIGSDNILTYEANRLLEDSIKKLYTINKVNPRLVIALASHQAGKVKFYAERNDIWSSSTLKLTNTSHEYIVESIDINVVINEFKPNFLLIDIEGAEYDLLPKLDLSNINKLLIELHKKYLGKVKVEHLVRLLEEKGFVCDTNLSREEQYYFYKPTI